MGVYIKIRTPFYLLILKKPLIDQYKQNFPMYQLVDVTFTFLKINGAKFKVNKICFLAIKLIANLHNMFECF
ncbi:hypothetical protein HZS_736 [Henneguya salminicola]|nr:hypothetical protein HZS_736 [Henneguya salminicola]